LRWAGGLVPPAHRRIAVGAAGAAGSPPSPTLASGWIGEDLLGDWSNLGRHCTTMDRRLTTL
jgi:hypothetical protein